MPKIALNNFGSIFFNSLPQNSKKGSQNPRKNYNRLVWSKRLYFLWFDTFFTKK